MRGYYSLDGSKDSSVSAADAMCVSGNGPFGVSPGSEKTFFPDDVFEVSGLGKRTACCGYVLNSSRYAVERGAATFAEALAGEEDVETVSERLHGAYAIVSYEEESGRLTITNDLLSKQPLYYCVTGTTLLFSTRYGEVLSGLRRLGETPVPDRMGLAMILHTGSLWEDFTPCRQIRVLRPFRYLTADRNGVSEGKLSMPVLNVGADRDAAIEMVDVLFSEAVKLQYEKNASAGYRQLGSLSGGMDSRSLLVRAEQLGYTDDLAFTYAQSGSLDMTISQQVAAHYRIPHLFFSMDGGGFLTDREGYYAGNEGMAIYCGSTALLKTLQSIDTEGFGLVHTAIAGGEIMGDIVPIDGDVPAGDRHLEILLDTCGRADAEGVERLRKGRAEYPTFNMFRQCNDIRANTNFMRIASPILPASSPFLYEPLFTFMMTLPMRMKKFRTFYYAWVDRKLKLPFRTTDPSLPVTTGILAERYARDAVNRIRKKVVRKSKYDMNPFDRWGSENPDLRNWIEETLRKDCAEAEGADAALLAEIERTAAGSVRDKLCALTAGKDLVMLLGAE